MEIFDFSEDRSLISIYLDNLNNFGLSRKDVAGLSDEGIIDIEDRIKNGLILFKGQVLMIKSTYNGDVLGSIPVIVSNVTRVNSTTIEYEFTMLTGDLNNELTKTSVDNSKLTDLVDINTDVENVLTAIKDSKLGTSTLYELQSKVGIDKLLVLKKLDNKIITYM